MTIIQRQKNRGFITVDADSLEQAKELVQSMIEDGEVDNDRIQWDETDVNEMRVTGACETGGDE